MKELLPYQVVGRDYLRSRSKALLADDPGLGKTAQALTAIPERGALVVTLAPLKGVWLDEAAEWRPEMPVSVLSGRSSFRWPEHGEIVVTNYDILPDNPGRAPPGIALIADEAQAVKNLSSRRSKVFREMRKAVGQSGGQVWLLTATPLFNRPPDLWGVLVSAGMHNDVFGGYDGFVKAFSGRDTKFGMVWGAPAPGVPALLAPHVLGRRREDVLRELPPKFYQTIRVDINAKAVPVVRPSTDGKNPDMSRARAALALQKAMAAVQHIIPLAERDPVVVFTSHRQAADVIAEALGVRAILGGGGDANEAVANFQDGKTNAIVGTVGALGTGFTLVRSNTAIFIDRDWSPSVNRQAEDRVMRIGQSRGVRIIDVVSDHPLERTVDRVVEKKEQIEENSLGLMKKKHGEEYGSN